MSCFFDTQPARSLRATYAQPASNLRIWQPQLYLPLLIKKSYFKAIYKASKINIIILDNLIYSDGSLLPIYLLTYLPTYLLTCLHRLPIYIAYLSALPTCLYRLLSTSPTYLHLPTYLYLPTR